PIHTTCASADLRSTWGDMDTSSCLVCLNQYVPQWHLARGGRRPAVHREFEERQDGAIVSRPVAVVGDRQLRHRQAGEHVVAERPVHVIELDQPSETLQRPLDTIRAAHLPVHLIRLPCRSASVTYGSQRTGDIRVIEIEDHWIQGV